MSWDDWSDQRINATICELKYGLSTDKDIQRLHQKGNYRFCSSWADMGPIIEREEIDMLMTKSDGTNIEGMVLARKVEKRIFRYHKNPLRAAAIVYLEMKGVKP